MSAPLPAVAAPHWRQDRLTEARGILADVAHHPDTLVDLACKVVRALSPDEGERFEALGVLRLLDPVPVPVTAPAPVPASIPGGQS